MKRKPHTPDEKAKLVLEVLRGERALNEIASENGIHPNMLSKWKKEAVTGLPSVFENDADKNVKNRKRMKRRLMNFTPGSAGLLLRMNGLKKIWPLSCVLPSAACWLILKIQNSRFPNRRNFWGLTGQAYITGLLSPAGKTWISRCILTKSILPIRNSDTAGSVHG